MVSGYGPRLKSQLREIQQFQHMEAILSMGKLPTILNPKILLPRKPSKQPKGHSDRPLKRRMVEQNGSIVF